MAATDFTTEAQLDSLTTTIATAVKANTTAHNAHVADASGAHAASAISVADAGALYTATDVEAALAEVKAIADAAAGGGTTINDAAINTTQAWSSQKISDEVAAAVAALIGGAPGALDTLNELAAAINDDATFTTTVTTALGLRVRVDAVQSFTSPQQLQGRENIGVIASTQDFAGDFTTLIA